MVLVLIVDMLAVPQDDAQRRSTFEVSMRSLQCFTRPSRGDANVLAKRYRRQLAEGYDTLLQVFGMATIKAMSAPQRAENRICYIDGVSISSRRLGDGIHPMRHSK